MPLKGEDRSKRAAPANTIGTRTARRMPVALRRKLKGCEERRPVFAVCIFAVSVFDVSFFFTSRTPKARVSHLALEVDWSFVQN